MFLGTANAPAGAPEQVYDAFLALGVALPIIRYLVMQASPPNIPVHDEAVLTSFIYILSIVSGVIASYLGSYWYGSLAIEVISAIISVYVSIGGTIFTMSMASRQIKSK